VGATGLSASPKEYRARLQDQPDDQVDAWVAEALRDISIRRGVLQALHDIEHATGVPESAFSGVFAAGGGPPAVVGRTAAGELMVPATTLHCLVPGIRAVYPDARERLIEYLVENFEDLIYV
jgi:hypothetical protein